jgi:hypothetical protein
MTLSTDIYLTGPVDAHEVYDFCNKLMGVTDPQFSDGPDEYSSRGDWEIYNELGQGFPAILSVSYRPDGELATEDEWIEEEDGYRYLDVKACTVKINFDTSYFYNDEFGGCSDLHARYIAMLSLWAEERGTALEWRNEYSGEFFHGTDGLESFSQNGKEASTWAVGAIGAVMQKIAEEGK